MHGGPNHAAGQNAGAPAGRRWRGRGGTTDSSSGVLVRGDGGVTLHGGWHTDEEGRMTGFSLVHVVDGESGPAASG
jgi:hypothetical protein